eukprot:3122276-Lingulodinium_polyedra.AAC.1
MGRILSPATSNNPLPGITLPFHATPPTPALHLLLLPRPRLGMTTLPLGRAAWRGAKSSAPSGPLVSGPSSCP